MNNLQETTLENKPLITSEMQLTLIDDVLRHYDYHFRNSMTDAAKIIVRGEIETLQSIRAKIERERGLRDAVDELFASPEAATLKAAGLRTRSQLIEDFPFWLEPLQAGEAAYGDYVKFGSFAFKDDRLIVVHRFERMFRIEFVNPQMPEDKNTVDIAITPETGFGLQLMLRLMLNDDDRKSFVAQTRVRAEASEGSAANE